MGTRSLTVMQDSWEEHDEIVVMYRQMDGYPEGHGVELTEFLKQFTVADGIVPGDRRKTANGGGCLAAQIVAHFKTEVGGFYLYPAGTRNCGEEYVYTVTPNRDGSINLKVESASYEDYETLYDGPVADFQEWVDTLEGEDLA